MSDEKLNVASKQVGRTVGFVGGPNAGQARVIPESAGDVVGAEGDYMYRIWPFRMPGAKETLHLAYAADQHPLNLLTKMWEEYSIAAQIRGGDHGYMQRIGKPSP